MNALRELPLHGVAVYNPELLSKQELIAFFVARGPLFERLLEDLRRDRAAQHHLLIGQRGMGKTTLLRRLRYAVEDDPELSARWLPLTFPEEQYNVVRLSDFYLNCIDALGDALDQQGRDREARALDEAVAALPDRDEPVRAQQALDLLLSRARSLGRRLLLLVDNVELILNRLESSQWALRELLSTEDRLLLIGASAAPMEATYKYEKPFYDFFQLHELRGLTEEETREVLTNLSRLGKTPAVERLLHDEPGRIQTFHALAGGNPRTIVLLYGVLAQGTEGDVRSDLERLLDLSTPLYKARFEALPEQSQQIVHALAIHWDPISAGELAERVRLDTNVVSSQLNRLAQQGVVEKVAYHPATKTGFQIAERFFNIWYLMRASRRVRQRLLWLVEFQRLLHGRDRLEQDAARHLHDDRRDDTDAQLRHAEYGLALAQVVREERLKNALESSAMRALVLDKALREKLSAFVDLDGEDAALKPLADRHRWAVELQETIAAAKVRWKGWDPKRFGDFLGGYPLLSPQNKLEIAGKLKEMPAHEVRAIIQYMEGQLVDFNRELVGSDLALEELCAAIRQGYMIAMNDVSGAEAAALALDMPGLPATAVALGPLHETSSAQLDILKAALPAARAPYPWFVLGWNLHYKQNKYEDAEAAYRRAIELNPSSPPAWRGLGGLLFYRLNRHQEAEAAFREAVKVNPSDASTWHSIGMLLHYHLKRHEEAEAAYRKSIEVNPSDASTWDSLGMLLHYDLKRYEEAELAFRKAIELDNSNASTWDNLGRLLDSGLERYEAAEAAYRKAIEFDPNYALTWRSLGALLDYHLHRYEEAETAYRKAIELDPSNALAWDSLGMLLHDHLNRHEEAEVAYRKAIELAPSGAWTWGSLGGLLHHHLNRHKEAEAAYRKAIELDPSRARIWYGLGSVLQEQASRYGEAEAAYQKAVQLDPTHARAWGRLALVRCQLEKIDQDTEAAARTAVDLVPTDPELALLLAVVLVRRGKWMEAAPLAARSLGTAPAEIQQVMSGILLLSFFAAVVQAGYAKEAAGLLDSADLGERFRPLREALLAIAEKSGDRLRRLAPEIRRPTEQLIAALVPEGLGAPSATPATPDVSPAREPVFPIAAGQPSGGDRGATTPVNRGSTKGGASVALERDPKKGATRRGKGAPVPQNAVGVASPTRRRSARIPRQKA